MLGLTTDDKAAFYPRRTAGCQRPIPKSTPLPPTNLTLTGSNRSLGGCRAAAAAVAAADTGRTRDAPWTTPPRQHRRKDQAPPHRSSQRSWSRATSGRARRGRGRTECTEARRGKPNDMAALFNAFNFGFSLLSCLIFRFIPWCCTDPSAVV